MVSGMRWCTDRSGRGCARAAIVLVLGTIALLAAAWVAPRTSEAVGTWVKSRTGVTTRTVTIEPGLEVGRTVRPDLSPAERLLSAREAGVATLDVGESFTMLGLMCDMPAGEGEVEVGLRTSLDGREWSAWYAAPLEVAGEDGTSPRAYTEALWSGEGRFVQVCAAADGEDAPLALTGVELVALDTEGDAGVVASAAGALRRVAAAVSGIDFAAPAQAAVETPAWVTRAAWGADESLRTGEPAYAPVKMAFVHHTAGGNTYTKTQAPSIVRGIYAYHTTGLGWNDIGYNFLVDRYGTVYVGRAGGQRQGVVGAHAYGFNTGSTGVAVMGTYTDEAPSAAATDALAHLLAWKLELHGLDPLASAKMTCGATEKYAVGQILTLPVVSGHRDANYTACPGDSLYASLAALRSTAAARIRSSAAPAAPYVVTLALSQGEVVQDTSVTYSGTARTAAGAPAAGTITLQKRAPGGAWLDWRTARLSAGGAWSVAVTMTNAPRDWQFRARLPADGANLAGTSPVADLRVTAPAAPYVVTLALSQGEVVQDTSVTYSGTARTAAGAPAAGTVTLQKRAPGGAWLDWRTARLSAGGAWSVAVTMTNAPRDWQFRARLPADGLANLAGTSPVADLRVTAPAAPYVVTLALSQGEVVKDTSVTYSGTARTAAGAPAAGTVTLQKRAPGGAWLDWRTARLSAGGAWSVAVTMTNAPRDWQFRARLPADGLANLAGTSPVADLRVTAPAAPYVVTLALSQGEVVKDTSVTYSGTARTAAGAPAAGTVTLQKRAPGGAWLDWRTARLSAGGAWSVAVTMTNAPRDWQFRARLPADGANLAGTSPVADLRVTAPAAVTQEVAFSISGRGWGHGVGMSQWGARGLAAQGSDYKAVLKHYYTGVGFADVGKPTVRVLLRAGLTVVKLTCLEPFTVRGTGDAVTIPGGTTATTTLADGKYRVVAGTWSRDFGAALTFAPTKGQLTVLTATDAGIVGSHRGTIRVLEAGGKLQMINDVGMQSYLRGVVPHEMPASWPAAALEAQACAARAYAERARRQATGSFDLYCDTRSQVYGGVTAEDPRSDAAVVATVGVVPSVGGAPIQALYFSCSGGQTENVELAWQSTPVSYLKAVDDPYDDVAPLHTWGPLSRTRAELEAALGSAVKGSLLAISRVERGVSPRIVKAAIVGSGGTTFLHGTTLRTRLSLNSTWATFTSLSIAPRAGDRVSVRAGDAVALEGRIYPALAEGAAVTLYSDSDGTWRSESVVTSRHTQALPDGSSAAYSAYHLTVTPSVTTRYYFARGGAVSPTTTITVGD